MRIITILLITLPLTACSLMGMGGDVFPPQPDWAKDAHNRTAE